MKILGVQTHYRKGVTNAADWWRTISPLTHLSRRGHTVEMRRGIVPQKVGKDPLAANNEKYWMQLGKYDVVHHSYNHSPLLYSCVRVACEKYNTKLIIDYDDNVIDQDLHNPTTVISLAENPHEMYLTQKIVRSIPNIIVTNNIIKDSFRRIGRKLPVDTIPNFIDLDIYKAPAKKQNKKPVIGFFGSTSHQADLYDKSFLRALSQVRKKYDIDIQIIGNFVPGFLDGIGQVQLIQGDMDFYRWVEIWKQHVCQWDIGLAPLRKTIFNKSRSTCKYQEYAAAHVPLVASDIGLYNPNTVLVSKSREDWVNNISTLIENPQKRIDVADKAHQDMVDNHQIQNNIGRWEALYERVVMSGV